MVLVAEEVAMELEERIELIKTAKKEGKKIAIYFVEDAGVAQFRYRVYNIMRAMEYEDTAWETVYFLKTEIKKAKKYLDDGDLFVILRQSAKDSVMMDLIDLIHAKKKKVLFDIDDLVFDLKYLRLVMQSTGSKNVLYWLGYMYGVRRIAKEVDGFLTTNDFLAKKIRQSFEKPCVVIPNSLNDKQVRIFDEKKKKHPGFVVGYFSGSPTHKKDFRVAEAGIIEFLNKHDDASLWVVGFMEFSEAMWRVIRQGKVTILDYANYLKMQTQLSEVDVNIAPLVVNDFTNCKSELKFFEAAVAETVTIASPAYTFKKAIKDGENGFLAKPGEWYEKLEYLYAHPKERQKIALVAKKYALKHYYGPEFLKQVEAAYEKFAK